MKGIPQIVNARTTASADDALAVLLAKVDKVAVGDMMHRMVKQFPQPVLAVFCVASRQIICTTHPDTAALIRSAWASDHGEELVVRPASNVPQLLTPWTLVSDTLADNALSSKLTNSFQKRSLYGLINTVGFDRIKAQLTEPCVLTDQQNGVVKFKRSDGSLAGALAAITLVGDSICVELSPKKTKNFTS